MHRVYQTIRQCLERKEYCSAAFLHEQAFERVWHKDLLYKINLLPHSMYLIIASYLSDRVFQVKQGDTRSALMTAQRVYPRARCLALCKNIFTYNLPQAPQSLLQRLTMLSFSRASTTPIQRLQKQLDETDTWLKKWRKKSATERQLPTRQIGVGHIS